MEPRLKKLGRTRPSGGAMYLGVDKVSKIFLSQKHKRSLENS
jgi:hypothetical protein